MAVTVETAQGTLEGRERKQDGGRHQVFLGIPFAQPPVGERRWCAPARPEPWTGVRSAVEIPNAAIQGQHPVPGMAASGPRSEDCLYLNVFTPAADGGRRPVLFWIHGGGFQLGSGSEALYDGGRLAVRGDVVVVAIHYRLGALGYLDLSGVGGDAWGATPNAGQLDQVAALRWVRQNVASFGGDPDNVTIFGESAGSAAVATLLAMPAARGLFRRAIMQSGTANALGDRESSAKLARAFLAEFGLESADAAKLREIPAERILKAQHRTGQLAGGVRALTYSPIVDGLSVPERPLDCVRSGGASEVEVIVGTNRDELKLFTSFTERDEIDAEKLAALVAQVLPKRAATRAAEIAGTYADLLRGRGLPCSNLDVLDAVQTDSRFRMPAIRLAEAQSAHQPGTHLYLFVQESPARRAGRLPRARAAVRVRHSRRAGTGSLRRQRRRRREAVGADDGRLARLRAQRRSVAPRHRPLARLRRGGAPDARVRTRVARGRRPARRGACAVGRAARLTYEKGQPWSA